MDDRIARQVLTQSAALSWITATDTCRHIVHGQHDLRGAAAQAVAELMVGTLLLATRLPGPGICTCTLSGNGSLGTVRVDAIGLGKVRALVPSGSRERVAQQPDAPLFGPGRCTVERRVEQRPVETSVLAVEGGPQSALSTVLKDSGLAARLLIQVTMDLDGARIAQARGLYVEAIGQADPPPAVLALLAGQHADLPADDAGMGAWLGGETTLLHTYPVSFHCPCSRERFVATLRGFEREQLLSLHQGGMIQVSCDFCKSSWQVPLDEVL